MRAAQTPSFEKLAELFEEIRKTPKVDVIIMSPEVWGQLLVALPDIHKEPSIQNKLGAIRIYIHWALGDVIVYGDRENKIIETILSTCEEAL